MCGHIESNGKLITYYWLLLQQALTKEMARENPLSILSLSIDQCRNFLPLNVSDMKSKSKQTVNHHL